MFIFLKKRWNLYFIILTITCFFLNPNAFCKNSKIILHERLPELILIKTNPNSQEILWEIIEYEGTNMIRTNKNFSDFLSFKKEFLEKEFPKSLNIKILGMWKLPNDPNTNEKSNITILNFLRNYGYEESYYKIIRKKYPEGGYNIYRWYRDKKFAFSYIGIIDKKVVTIIKNGYTFPELIEIFNDKKSNRSAKIELNYYPSDKEIVEFRKIEKILKKNGYNFISHSKIDRN